MTWIRVLVSANSSDFCLDFDLQTQCSHDGLGKDSYVFGSKLARLQTGGRQDSYAFQAGGGGGGVGGFGGGPHLQIQRWHDGVWNVKQQLHI